MNDYLLRLNQYPRAKKLVKGLGLPIPLPEAVIVYPSVLSPDPHLYTRTVQVPFGKGAVILIV